MTEADRQTLALFFAPFLKIPVIRLEGADAYLSVDDGALTISPCTIDRKSIKGTIKVPGFVLETFRCVSHYPSDPDDVEVVEITQEQNKLAIFARAAVVWAELQVEVVRERLDNEALAQEYQKR